MEVNTPCRIVQFPSGGGSTSSKIIKTPVGDYTLEFLIIAGLLLLILFKDK